MSLLTDVQVAVTTFVNSVATLVQQTSYLISVITGPSGGSTSLVDVGPRTLKTLARVLLEIEGSSAFNSTGAWNSGTTYGELDAVSYNGFAYISMQAGNLNNQPNTSPAYWMQLVGVPVAPIMETIADFQLSNIDAAVNGIVVLGYGDAGDGGGALYKRVVSEPSHPGKLQSADGAWWEIADAELNIESFGAIGDLTTDCAPAIQNCTDAATAQGKGIYIPTGLFRIAATIAVADSTTFRGNGGNVFSGDHLSGIFPDQSVDAFQVDTSGAVTFRDFIIWYLTPSDSGVTAIKIDATGTQNFYSRILNMSIFDCHTLIDFVVGLGFQVTGCLLAQANITHANAIGLRVANSFAPDAGDCVVAQNDFRGHPTNTLAIIYHQSAGGLRINNNKLNAAVYGIYINLAASTSILMIEGNSIENTTGMCVVLQRANATAIFFAVHITGNQLNAGGGVGVIYSPLDANGVWLSMLNISDNNILAPASAGRTLINISSVSGLMVDGNIYSQEDVTATSRLLFVGSSVDQFARGVNRSIGVFAANSISSTNTLTVQTVGS